MPRCLAARRIGGGSPLRSPADRRLRTVVAPSVSVRLDFVVRANEGSSIPGRFESVGLTTKSSGWPSNRFDPNARA